MAKKKSAIVHLRDQRFTDSPIHFRVRMPSWQLTDNPEKVTCKMCLKMVARCERYTGVSR